MVFYGVGVVLYSNPSHYFHICYASGKGTNMKVKFNAIWNFLLFTNMKGIVRMQVMRDSKFVINWANKRVMVENVRLGNILQVIKQTLQTFQWIVFMHVYQEHNKKDDEL